MEENLQGGEGFLMEGNLQEMGVSEPVTPIKPAVAWPLLSIKRDVNEEKFVQNFDAGMNSTDGFEENGVNFTLTVELGDHERTSPDSWRNVEGNSRYQNCGVGMVKRLDIGSMLKLLGVDHVNSKDQTGNGIDSTNSAASQGKDSGITDTGSGSECGFANLPQNLKRSEKEKNTNGDVERRPRMKMKKHRPKIFDVMKPKKVPKAQKLPKSKKRKDTEEPKSVLLLELISGKPPHSVSIVTWASKYLNDKQSISYLIDPSLKSFKENELAIICEVIQECIQSNARKRPTMGQVTSKLRVVLDISPEFATPRLSPLQWAELEILST